MNKEKIATFVAIMALTLGVSESELMAAERAAVEDIEKESVL